MFNLGHSCSTAPATQITLWEAHAREALDLFALHIPKRNELSGVGTLVKVAGFSPSLSGGNSGYLAW